MSERKTVHKGYIGNLQVTLTGVGYSGEPILDTEVKIEPGVICAITWSQKDEFLQDIQTVIDKYRI